MAKLHSKFQFAVQGEEPKAAPKAKAAAKKKTVKVEPVKEAE